MLVVESKVNNRLISRLRIHQIKKLPERGVGDKLDMAEYEVTVQLFAEWSGSPIKQTQFNVTHNRALGHFNLIRIVLDEVEKRV